MTAPSTAAVFASLATVLVAAIFCCNSAEALSVSVSSSAGQFLPELADLRLHCSVSEKPDYIFWYYSAVQGGTDRSVLARCHLDSATCAVEPSFKVWTNLVAMGNGTLSLTEVARSQDGYYECEAFRDRLDAKQGIRIVIVVSGSEPSISQSPALLTSGDLATFTCSSGSGWNPPPRLDWVKNPMASAAGPSAAVSLTSAAVYSPPVQKFGAASSKLSLRMDSADHEAVLVCSTAQTELNNASVASAQLKLLVQHKPTIASIADLTAVEGSSVTVACSARGYPTPQLQLIAANGSAVQNSSSGLFSLSPVHRSQAGGLACRAVNPLGAATAAFRLFVLYPPTVRTPASATVDAGGSVALPCSVDGNPQPAEIVWRHGVTGAVVAPSADGALRLDGADPQRHGGEWRCEARSILSASAGPPIEYTASSSVILTVRYRPGPPEASQPRFPLLAGESVNLTCRLNQVSPGQPAPSLAWVRIDSAPAAAPIPPGPGVRFSPIGLSDSGSYACRAVNELGASESAPVSLMVRQAPILTIDSAPSTVDAARVGSTDFRLVCRARANPAPRLRWLQRNGARMPPELFTELAGLGDDPFEYQLTLHFRGFQRSTLRLNDTGLYHCLADNELGNGTAEYRLEVMTEPAIVNAFDKAALVPGAPAALTCQFISHSGYRVTWLTPDGRTLAGRAAPVDEANGQPWWLESPPPLPDGGAQPALGNYTCQVNNSLGSVHRRLQLVAATTPDPPRRLSAVPLAWNSVRLAWQPGFDGGYPARLRLRLVGWNASVGARAPTSPPLLIDAQIGEASISGLYPDTAYSVVCVAENRIGESVVSPDVVVTTGHLRLPQVQDASWDPATGRLAFRGLPGYCARVEASDDAGATWRTPSTAAAAASDATDCLAYQPGGLSVAAAPASVPAEAASSGAATGSLTSSTSEARRTAVLYRVSLCLANRTDVCGSPFTTYPLAVPGTVSLSTIIIVACVCSVVITALAIVLIWLCTRRCRQARAKAADKAKQQGGEFELQAGKQSSYSADCRQQRQGDSADNNGGLHHHPAVAFVSPTSVTATGGLASPPRHGACDGTSPQLDGTVHLFPNTFYESDATDNSGSPPTLVKNHRRVIYEVVV